ncbi:haloacid dehalogenase type II [Novosphingobium sediminicola]|uniref:haloacid dehalogenase type II n=1 Tax=Novosphingobium sediminicola TaxID=563162 RepID=UPI0016129536|nr:haloacid dehalogenase type II [Novosphingobium sediminicola]
MTHPTFSLSRRSALGLAMAALPAGLKAGEPRLRALAFDGFTIFDVRAVTAVAVALFPAQGVALAAQWTAKIFALSWLETAAGRYSGFAALADAALGFCAANLGLSLSETQRRELISVFAHLPAWPDAGERLEKMRQAGLRLTFLSNLSEAMLEGAMRANGLHGLMEPPLSTDRVRVFKPAPQAYAMACEHFAMPREAIGFVAFGGWDALGAKWFGYRTAWINRLGVAAEPLMPPADATGPDLGAAMRLAGI